MSSERPRYVWNCLPRTLVIFDSPNDLHLKPLTNLKRNIGYENENGL